ncbi:MAG: type II secretion system protein [Thermodesulfobacteriota bacterium]
MNNRQGFTITELLVATAVAGILVALFVGYHKTGFFREYQLSQEARSLAAALNAARMKATENRMSVKLTSSNCTGVDVAGTVSWDREWTFIGESAVPSGFTDGDFVSFSNLDVSGMNGGAFQIFGVSEIEDTTQKVFRLTFRSNFHVKATDVAASSTYGSGGKAPAFAKDQTRAAELIIRRESQVDLTDQRFSSDQYYLYKDRPLTGGLPTIVITESNDRLNRDATGNLIMDKVTVFYNSLGLPANEAGYSLAVSYVPNGYTPGAASLQTGVTPFHTKIVTVTPVGRTVLGSAGK